MTNDNQTLTNRRNALLSTGPKTPAGRSKSSKNALAHGLYSATIVPAIGESPAALAELSAVVHAILNPEGVLEERRCDRIALLFLRYNRVARFETAVVGRDGAAAVSVIPAPDTIIGAGVDLSRAPHPQEPIVFRLAYARARVTDWALVLEAIRAARAALGETCETDVTIPASHVRWLVLEVGCALGWNRDDALAQWTAANGMLDGSIPSTRFVTNV